MAERQRFEREMAQLGVSTQLAYQPAAVAGEVTAPPRGLVLLEHWHVPKKPNPAQPDKFITEKVARLEAKNMNPGFINAGDELQVDSGPSGLQTCLKKLITTQFQDFLSNRRNQGPAKGDRLRVALVDLTGKKLTQPDLAGWGSTLPMEGWSLPKILGMYAAHQLRADLRHLAADQGINKGPELEKAATTRWKNQGLTRGLPDLKWLFDLSGWSGDAAGLDFSSTARGTFDTAKNVNGNCPQGQLIIKVGFPFIASVVWQSGLFHPDRGGLWLRGSYCKKGSWGGNPVKKPAPVHSHNATALATASFFTLLAQGRLADDATSNSVKSILKLGCVTNLFPGELSPFKVAAKCGLMPIKNKQGKTIGHDVNLGVLVDRGDVRYAAAVLTRNIREYSQVTQLFRELDRLITENNQTPKPNCE